MPKDDAPIKPDEEWEDVDEREEEEEGGGEEEEEDTTINNSDVVVKYKKVSQWTNEVLKALIEAAKPGAKVIDLCIKGDQLIAEKVATMFKGVSKGPAYPVSISVNNCVSHNSPVPAEDTNPQVLAEGDVVHIDLGIQVDGYSAVAAHTVILSPDNQLPDSKEGNVIQAAYTALNTAVRKLRPGSTNLDVTDVIEKVASHFGVSPVEGVLGHEIKRYIIDGLKTIPCKKSAEFPVYEYDIEPAHVWTIDVALTTGKGRLREGTGKTSIYKINIEGDYQPKMDVARDFVKEIDKKFETFPFSIRSAENPVKARLAIAELLRHNVLLPYPALCEREGEVVGHFKMTVLVTPKKIERTTGVDAQKPIKAAAPFTDPALLEASKLPFSLEEKKKKN